MDYLEFGLSLINKIRIDIFTPAFTLQDVQPEELQFQNELTTK